MDSILVSVKDGRFLPPSQQPYVMFPPTPPTGTFNLNNKVSPSILLIIIILAIIFFISGVLHLLVRFLLRPQNRDPDEMDNVTALQGQLQQLFHLHDAGVDQSFIDALPVFNYKAIIGVKDPFDCAVCLCEFEAEDKLRLLPKCSHAFHMECIDTWLLSHSTCPLCRASLLSDFSPNNSCSPVVLVLESGSSSSREIAAADAGLLGRTNSAVRANSTSCLSRENEDFGRKSCEIQTIKEEEVKAERVVAVKLGKFKNVDKSGGGEGGGTNDDDNVRRCFSMGSFAYVMDETSSLQVPIRTPLKKSSTKKPSLPPLTPGHRPAMSECGGCDSRREFEAFKILEIQTAPNDETMKSIRRSSNKESFSVSKIWLRGKRDNNTTVEPSSSRRAFSFRFPVHRNPAAAEATTTTATAKNGRRTASEINWGNGSNELRFDEELESCNSLDSQPNAPSFARRTLLWLMGKPNKVVHSSFSTNV